MQIQGILKPMPEYGVHYRADVEFTARGREFIVDDALVAKENGELEKEIAAREKILVTPRAELTTDDKEKVKDLSPDMIEAELGALKRRRAKIANGIVDRVGKPLLFSSKIYKYFEEGIGRVLVLEHWDGKDRPPEVKALTVDERLARLEQGFNDLVAALKAKK